MVLKIGTMAADGPDWFLRDWLARLGKRQASLVNELGWNKSRANLVYHGEQPYRRDVVNELANWLKIRPYELLMHPDEAMALRSLRDSALVIVREAEAVFEDQPAGADNERKARPR